MKRRFVLAVIAAAGLSLSTIFPDRATAASAEELNAEADAALTRLQQSEPVTEKMIKNAKGILIFPDILKAGLLIGGATGEGVLRVGGRPKDISDRRPSLMASRRVSPNLAT
jgi:lipid-binding SYLF domain-containing protein